MIHKVNTSFFHYDQLKICTHPQVYEPAEDTFLLLEAIYVYKNAFVFEIGTGTGIIALSCAQKGAMVVCSDINPYAVDLVQKNIRQNMHLLKGYIEVRMGDLYKVLHSDERFDIIIFNPPYLPIFPEERTDSSSWLDIAIDGGKTGLDVTHQFLKDFSKHIKPNGRGYFIYSDLSGRNLLNTYLETYKLQACIGRSSSFYDESLEIYEITV